MLKKIYYWLHSQVSLPAEKNEYSAGVWQDKIRKEVFAACKDTQGPVLEVGCGEGLFLERLAKERPDLSVWGVDNSSLRIEEAGVRKKRNNLANISLAVEDAARLSFPAEHFDAVVCINVIFNLPSVDSVRQVLGEIRRVCKGSGKIYFDFRNASNPLLFLKYRLAPFYDETVRNLPLRTYSLKQVEGILRELGIKIVKRTHIGFPVKLFAPIIIIEAAKC